MDKKYYDLVIKDLSGNISPEEKAELLRWIPRNEKLYNEMRELWETCQVPEDWAIDEKKAWTRLRSRIENYEKPSRGFFRTSRLIKVAAVALILLSGFVIVYNSYHREEVIATKNHIEIFYLPDSSQVWLNKNSSLQIRSFGAEERVVYLDGEAFFQVTRDPSRPFIVVTKNSRTRVLGTSFDIKAYPEDPEVAIEVESGTVEFSATKGKTETVKLEKSQKAFVNKATGHIQKHKDPDADKWIGKRYKNKEKNLHLKEASRPGEYLHHDFTWRDNFIKQVIVEGKILNGAIFTTYKNVKLKATYYTSDKNKIGFDYYTITDYIRPGGFLKYKFKLNNWFREASKVEVEIEEAHSIQ